MNDITLVVMAAGMGSRFGGLKQIEPLGPTGETIADYSIFDAVTGGFTRVVFVIRRAIEDDFTGLFGRRIEKQVPVTYVFQEEAAPPRPGATKLWGTGQAVLSTAGVVNEPFAVINADDYYGRESFGRLAEHLRSGVRDCAMIGFRLSNTLSEFGPVKRGLCAVDDGYLRDVTELDVERDGQTLTGRGPDGRRRTVRGDETVSMNMWGFTPEIFDEFQTRWSEFLQQNGQSPSAEFYIPSVVTALVNEGRGRCRVLPTPSAWFGVTYREDVDVARAEIGNLVAGGYYPQDLWSA